VAEFDALEQTILTDIAAAVDEAALESVRVSALGKKGSVSALLATLGKMTPEQRKAMGPAINGLKDRVTAALAARRQALKDLALDLRLNTEIVDVTLPLPDSPAEQGRIHPISQVTDELTAIFADMGFAIAEGPDIETDDYNFTKLNFPEGHAARDMHDTFFFPEKSDGSCMLLRTHTSPVQVRTMLSQKPPIRVICPGRTYRCDSDQTHTPMFHQVEGLVIDKGSHLGHLKWILAEFCKAFFEVDHVKMRFRPSFFPFTEPSLEVDIQCRRDRGEIRFGEGEDWLEILGCGMVHPNVLKNCGLDPEEYQGFAWGLGIDRIAMLKYGMPDLRAFFEADVRWLSYYGFRPLDFPTLAGGLSGDIYSGARAQTGSKMTQMESVMARDKLTEIVEQALRDALGAKVLDRVEVTEGIDHDGEAALFVTVHYRSGTDTVDQTAALSSVRDRLRTAGENRFPYMNHVYPDDPLAEDEADDVRSAS
jgi:phenylalanyl-tRNA synthetase alpha chain